MSKYVRQLWHNQRDVIYFITLESSHEARVQECIMASVFNVTGDHSHLISHPDLDCLLQK